MKKSTTKKAAILLTMVILMGVFISGCIGSIPTSKINSPADDTSDSQTKEREDTEQGNDSVAENETIEGNKSSGSENSESKGDEKEGSEAKNVNNAEDEQTKQPPKDKVKVKALYLTGWTVGIDERLKHYVELANTTEINSYVVDIKDDDGYVGYESQIPEVREIGAYINKYNVDKILKEFHDNDIHVIGRLVCFKDPVLAQSRTELAIKDVNGGLWMEKTSEGDVPWLSPANRDSWSYIIDIAKEAVGKGFDEIQFDYVRFPTGGNKNSRDYGHMDSKMHEYINEFLAYAKSELPGVILSADVYGIICESPGDTEGIGQYLELVGKDIDYISPMVYPSHYAVGQVVNGVRYAKPDFEPYSVVYNSLKKAKDRISSVAHYNADVRAYLQDFTASWLGDGWYMKYGAEQVRQQIQAVYDAGYEEWILWSAVNEYSERALLKE